MSPGQREGQGDAMLGPGWERARGLQLKPAGRETRMETYVLLRGIPRPWGERGGGG